MAKKIRAHHLLCILRYYSGGYNKRFAQNMKKICLEIRKNPSLKIKVVVGKLDALCKKCPHKQGKECIQSKEIGRWVVLEDKKVARYLKLKPNSVHKAKDIFNLSIKKINEKTIKSICKGCIFVDNCAKVGINNSFRMELNN